MTYIIEDRGEYKICLPETLSRANLESITAFGDEWATFIDTKTGKIHHCAKYFEAAMKAEREGNQHES